MAVQADVAKKERDAQRLREKMRDMGLHKYDESVHTFPCLTEHLQLLSTCLREYSELQQEQEKKTREVIIASGHCYMVQC